MGRSLHRKIHRPEMLSSPPGTKAIILPTFLQSGHFSMFSEITWIFDPQWPSEVYAIKCGRLATSNISVWKGTSENSYRKCSTLLAETSKRSCPSFCATSHCHSAVLVIYQPCYRWTEVILLRGCKRKGRCAPSYRLWKFCVRLNSKSRGSRKSYLLST